MSVVVRRYIDILTIIINFPSFTCIRSFFGSNIPTSLFILKMFFRSLQVVHELYRTVRVRNLVSKQIQILRTFRRYTVSL